MNLSASETRQRLRQQMQMAERPGLASVVKLVRDLSNRMETIPAQVLAQLVFAEPQLSQRILASVNRLHFHAQIQPLTNLSDAIVVAGFKRVRTLAYAYFLTAHLKRPSDAALIDLCTRSVCSGIAASLLMQSFYPKLADDAFLGATLQDFGEWLLAAYLPAEYNYSQYLASTREPSAAFAEVFGVQPRILGQEVLKEAKLPLPLLRATQEPPASLLRQTTPGDEECLTLVPAFAKAYTRILLSPDSKGNIHRHQLSELLWHFRHSLPLSEADLHRTTLGLAESLEDLRNTYKLQGLAPALLRQIKRQAKDAEDTLINKAANFSLSPEEQNLIHQRPTSVFAFEPETPPHSDQHQLPAPPDQPPTPLPEQPQWRVLTPPPGQPFIDPAQIPASAETPNPPTNSNPSAPPAPSALKPAPNHEARPEPGQNLAHPLDDPAICRLLRALTEELQSLSEQVPAGDNPQAIQNLLPSALERLAKALNCSECILFLHSSPDPLLHAAHGFGSIFQDLGQTHLSIPASNNDLFALALNRKEDIQIDNLREPGILRLLPSWLRMRPTLCSLLLLPIRQNDQTRGLLLLARNFPERLPQSLPIRKELTRLRAALLRVA